MVLDVCCGGRMFWYDKHDSRAVYVDRRVESLKMNDSTASSGFQTMEVKPDIQADFIRLPFRDSVFDMVVFDPPHLKNNGAAGWLTMRYGRLDDDWEFMITEGFIECFRVLKLNGTLIFKWNELDIPISKVLQLTNIKPLFGHKSGKQSKTHWVSFIK